MSDDYFSALADDASKVIKQTKQSTNNVLSKNSGCLPKIFTVIFIALLLYMGFNIAKFSPPPQDGVGVGGVFYGNIKPDKNGNINIPLGNKDKLNNTIDVSKNTNPTDQKDNPDENPDDPKQDTPKTEPSKEPKTEPKPSDVKKPTSNKTSPFTIKITDRLKVGMSYFDVLALLGAPSKKMKALDDNKLETGFMFLIWDVDSRRLMITFYKNKLNSVSFQ